MTYLFTFSPHNKASEKNLIIKATSIVNNVIIRTIYRKYCGIYYIHYIQYFVTRYIKPALKTLYVFKLV